MLKFDFRYSIKHWIRLSMFDKTLKGFFKLKCQLTLLFNWVMGNKGEGKLDIPFSFHSVFYFYSVTKYSTSFSSVDFVHFFLRLFRISTSISLVFLFSIFLMFSLLFNFHLFISAKNFYFFFSVDFVPSFLRLFSFSTSSIQSFLLLLSLLAYSFQSFLFLLSLFYFYAFSLFTEAFSLLLNAEIPVVRPWVHTGQIPEELLLKGKIDFLLYLLYE